MNGHFAIDTNVAVYAFSKDERRTSAMALLEAGPKISIQPLNEFTFVSLRKRKVPSAEIEESLDIIERLSDSIRLLAFDTHLQARSLAQGYQLGFYDSFVLASAMLDNCDRKYSEDMQHGMVIDGTLTITNPFLPAKTA